MGRSEPIRSQSSLERKSATGNPPDSCRQPCRSPANPVVETCAGTWSNPVVEERMGPARLSSLWCLQTASRPVSPLNRGHPRLDPALCESHERRAERISGSVVDTTTDADYVRYRRPPTSDETTGTERARRSASGPGPTIVHSRTRGSRVAGPRCEMTTGPLPSRLGPSRWLATRGVSSYCGIVTYREGQYVIRLCGSMRPRI